jgi:hypothetical protein
VRGTGEYFVAVRRGGERTVVTLRGRATPRSPTQDADSGVQSNVLGAEVRGDRVIFTVNGTEVVSHPRSAIPTDGLTGFRINHNLDVRIDQVRR